VPPCQLLAAAANLLFLALTLKGASLS